jgi:HEAT repeat protein
MVLLLLSGCREPPAATGPAPAAAVGEGTEVVGGGSSAARHQRLATVGPDESLPAIEVLDIQLAEDAAWMLTDWGLVRYDRQTEKVTRLAPPEGRVTGIALDKGELWVGASPVRAGGTTLWRYRPPESWESVVPSGMYWEPRAGRLEPFGGASVFVVTDQAVWFGGSAGVLARQGKESKERRFFPVPAELRPFAGIRALGWDPPHVWVGTMSDVVYRFDVTTEQWSSIDLVPDRRQPMAVTGFVFTPHRVGMLDWGCVWWNRADGSVTREETFPALAAAVHDGKTLWLGISDGGIHRYNERLKRWVTHTAEGVRPAGIHVVRDDGDRLWIGAKDGAYILDKATGAVGRLTALRELAPKEPSLSRAALEELRHGGKDWMPAFVAAAENAGLDVRRYAMEELGRTHDPRVLPVLLRALKDDDVAIRRAAIGGLAILRPVSAAAPLTEIVRRHSTATDYYPALQALEAVLKGHPDAWEQLSPENFVTAFAYLAGEPADPRLVARLNRLYEEAGKGEYVLQKHFNDESLDMWARLLRTRPDRRYRVTQCLFYAGVNRWQHPHSAVLVKPLLAIVAKEPAGPVLAHGVELGILARVSGAEVVPVLARFLREGHRGEREFVMRALRSRFEPSLVPDVLKALEDSEPRVRSAACSVVGEFLLFDALPEVRKLTGDADAEVSRQAARALAEIDVTHTTSPPGETETKEQRRVVSDADPTARLVEALKEVAAKKGSYGRKWPFYLAPRYPTSAVKEQLQEMMLRSPDDWTRLQAARALLKCRDPAYRAAFRQALQDPYFLDGDYYYPVRELARRALNWKPR